MASTQRSNLVKLGDNDLTVGDQSEDIRGRKVIDSSGDEIGEVDALMIDEDESRVRFMLVAAGGFLGIGEKTFLIPIDVITNIHDDHVHVDQTRDRIMGSPDYDPELVEDEGIWEQSYGHYGMTPFWGMGYAYPAYPYYAAGAATPGRLDPVDSDTTRN